MHRQIRTELILCLRTRASCAWDSSNPRIACSAAQGSEASDTGFTQCASGYQIFSFFTHRNKEEWKIATTRVASNGTRHSISDAG